jgi:hypothetical protein
MKAPAPPCSNVESFCLMWYGTGAGRIRIWNSRDGVTPFYIDGERKHENWELDEFRPLYVPAIGDWVFVDLTLEVATEYRRGYVDRFWNVGTSLMADRYSTKENAIRALAMADMANDGTPDLVQICDEFMLTAIVANARSQCARLGILRPMGRRFIRGGERED